MRYSNSAQLRLHNASRELVRTLNWGSQMKKYVVAAAGLLMLGASAASAADLGPRMVTKAPPMYSPVYNWTGFYLGVNGGYGWANSTHIDSLGRSTGSFNQNGGMVGGTAGYNWQLGSTVLGLETDLDWARINGSTAAGACAFGACYTNMQSFGTFRGRLGYAAGMWMPYVTGGLAYADIKSGQTVATSSDQWRAGWTVGAGVEAMFAPSWSAKLEYLYADFGTSGGGAYTTPAGINVAASERNVNIVRAGINYHFDWGGPVVARY